MRMTGRRCKRIRGLGDRSQPGRLGEIDLEAVALALIAAGHFGAGVAEVLLHMRLLDLRGGGEAGAQRVAAEGALAARLRSDRREFPPSSRIFARAARRACRSVARRRRRRSCARCGRNSGPCAMRPRRIQVSSKATGQVSGREPRPISTSRQPVLPLIVSRAPAASKSRSSRSRLRSDSGPRVEADDLGAA